MGIMACSWNRKLSAWKSHHALPRRVRLWSENGALCLEVPSYTSLQGTNLIMKMSLSAWKPHHALPCRMQLNLPAWKSHQAPPCKVQAWSEKIGRPLPGCPVMHFLGGCNFCLH